MREENRGGKRVVVVVWVLIDDIRTIEGFVWEGGMVFGLGFLRFEDLEEGGRGGWDA